MAQPPVHIAKAPEAPDAATARELLNLVVERVGGVLWGQARAVRMVVAAVCGRGHVLLEDVPGVGKTMLARALARVLGCSFQRIQFTSDMLPNDVTGVQVLDRGSGDLRFRKGPIFADMVLADEINRASPKTQSAMLEAMADQQVTVDERSYALGKMFTVLATQNPVEHHGAYPLPESQLDRFMVRISLGYPPEAMEKRLLLEPHAPEDNLQTLVGVLSPEGIEIIRGFVDDVVLSDRVADYLLTLVRETRAHADVDIGASPRASASFASLCRAWAFLAGRDHVLPDDVKETARSVLAHRVVVHAGDDGSRRDAMRVVDELLERVPVPR